MRTGPDGLLHPDLLAERSYTFDPRTDRLVQLFPEQFWFETSMAVGALILLLCAAVWWLAGRRSPARSGERAAAPAALEPLR